MASRMLSLKRQRVRRKLQVVRQLAKSPSLDPDRCGRHLLDGLARERTVVEGMGHPRESEE